MLHRCQGSTVCSHNRTNGVTWGYSAIAAYLFAECCVYHTCKSILPPPFSPPPGATISSNSVL